MYDSQDLVQKINDTYASMSKGQKQIRVCVKNYDKAAFMTALRLLKRWASANHGGAYAMAWVTRATRTEALPAEMVRNKLTASSMEIRRSWTSACCARS